MPQRKAVGAALVVAGVLALVGVFTTPATADPLEQAFRKLGQTFVVTVATGAALDVDQRGSGSIATFRDGGTSEYTFDQSAYTFTNSGTMATGDVTAGEIADVVRQINIPLGSFIDCQTDAGAAIGFGEGVDALADFINSATDGTGFVIRFDDTGSSEDQSSEVCSQILVPADYASGGSFVIRALKDAHTAATEVINCAVSVNGAALETAGTVTTTTASSTAYTCTPTIAALAASDSLSLYVSVTSGTTMNDIVDVAAVGFRYTATQ